MAYTFGRFQLDPDRFELLRDGARVAVEPQALQLVQNRTVCKDEIVETV